MKSWCLHLLTDPGALPVPLNNFRDEDSNTRVYRVNWDRVITPTLLNRVSFGQNDWFQLRASFNRDQGWGTKIGLRNVPPRPQNLGSTGLELTSQNFGRVTTLANSPRQVQLGLRFEF